MGLVKNFPPCLQLIAVFSQYDDAFEWAWSEIHRLFGPIAMQSPRFDFNESGYYRSSMGERLIKQFAILENWCDPAELADHKLASNQLELDYSIRFPKFEVRPLNVDPGYLSLTKLVLASTKNREHRIYLREGIYAEVTLAFRNQEWTSLPWTYPDYQRQDFRVFFLEARKYLLWRIQSIGDDAQSNSMFNGQP